MKVLNIQETADALRVSVSTIRKLVKDKKIKSFRVAYRLYFTEESIESFIREQEAESVQKTSYSQNRRNVMFRYFNANKFGNHVEDCTIRAISVAEGIR